MTDSCYILRVRPGTELSVAEAVPATYVPTVRVSTFNRRLRKRMTRIVALIPGYVFVYLSEFMASAFRHLPDVLGFMRNGDRSPAVLHAKEMKLLKEVEVNANGVQKYLNNPVTRKPLAVGQIVQLKMLRDKTIVAIVKEIRGDRFQAEAVGSQVRFGASVSSIVA